MALPHLSRHSNASSSDAIDGTNYCLRTEFEKESQTATLSLFLDSMENATNRKKINFCFCLSSELGVDPETSIMDAYESEDLNIGHCPTGRSLQRYFTQAVRNAFELVINTHTVFLHGADKFDRQLKPKTVDRLYSAYLRKLLDSQVNTSRNLIFPLQSFDSAGINSIFNMLHRFLSENPTYSKDVSFFYYTLKNEEIDFSGLDQEVVNVITPYAQEISKVVFNTVWHTTRAKLPNDLKLAMDEVDSLRRLDIQDYLANGILQGGSRLNDRPWGIDKTTEECRKRLLSMVVSNTIPVYSASDKTLPPATTFFKRHVEGLLKKLSLPYNSLQIAAPALKGAIQRQSKK